MLKVHVLVENTVHRRSLRAEHGLSLWVETDSACILFDTGASDQFALNAGAMGVDLRRTTHAVLSHGHYDHCGGLGASAFGGLGIPIHHHGLLSEPKYVYMEGQWRYTGVPWQPEDIPGWHAHAVINEGPLEIAPNAWLSGTIPMQAEWEQIPSSFYVRRRDQMEADSMADEQMLILRRGDRLHVFGGCSHRGVANSIRYAQELFPQCTVASLTAGMHLQGVPRGQLQSTLDFLQSSSVRTVVPLHCTGFEAACAMRQLFGERCVVAGTGDAWELEPAAAVL